TPARGGLLHQLVEIAVDDIDDVDLARCILRKGGHAAVAREALRRGDSQRGRGVARDMPDATAAVVAEHVATDERRNRGATIDETARDRIAGAVTVLRDRVDARRTRSAGVRQVVV